MLKLTILSPEKKTADQVDVQSVTLPGTEGQIQVLPEHAEMVGILETGPFSYVPVSGEPLHGVISHGFFEVVGDVVTVMAETCELANEIDANRAKIAQKKAENALLDPELDQKHFKKYELKLERAIIRQQVAAQN